MVKEFIDIEYLKDILESELNNSTAYNTNIVIKRIINRLYTRSDEMDDFYNKLRIGVVHFLYRKVNGETREAWGTLKADILENYVVPASKSNSHKIGYITYYDLEKNAWRCFRINQFIKIL